MDQEYKFDAFISYRHVKPDTAIVEKIQQYIEDYVVPKELRKQDEAKPFRIFRDTVELTTKDLNTSLEEALDQSNYLIVVCSKRTPESPWCQQEVVYFSQHHPTSHIIPVLVEGEPSDSFPEALRELKTVKKQEDETESVVSIELLAADVRPDAIKNAQFVGYETLEQTDDPKLAELTKQSLKRLKTQEIHRIVATMLGVNYGDLKQRQKERQLKRLVTIGSLIGSLLLFFGAAMTYLYLESVRNEREAKAQTALVILQQASDAIEQGDRTYALKLGEVAMASVTDSMPQFSEIKARYHTVLNNGLLTLPFTPESILKTKSQYASYAVAEDDSVIYTPSEKREIVVWDTRSGGIKETIAIPSPAVSISLEKGTDQLFCAIQSGGVLVIDLKTKEYQVLVEESSGAINEIRVSDSGNHLFALQGQQRLLVYRTSDAQVVADQLNDLMNRIQSISINPETDDFVITKMDNSRILYSSQDGKKLETIQPVKEDGLGSYVAGQFSEDGRYFVYVADGKLVRYDVESGKRSEEDIPNISMIKLTKDGEKVFYSNYSSNVYQINLETGETVSFSNVNRDVQKIALSRDETILAIKYSDGTLGHVDLSSLGDSTYISVDVQDFIDENLVQGSFEFTPNDNFLLTNGEDASIRLTQVSGGLDYTTLSGKVIAQSANKSFILLEKEDGHALYNLNTESEISVDPLSVAGEVNFLFQSVALSNDGGKLAVADTSAHTVAVYDVKTGQEMTTLVLADNPSGTMVSMLRFSSDDSAVFASFGRGTFQRLPIVVGDTKFTFQGPDSEIKFFRLSDDERMAAISYFDGTFEIVSLPEGEIIYEGDGELVDLEARKQAVTRATILDGQEIYRIGQDLKPNYVGVNEYSGGVQLTSFYTSEVSPNHRMMLTPIDGRKQILQDLETGQAIWQFQTKELSSASAFFDPTGEKVFLSNGDQETLTVKIADYDTLVKRSETKIKSRLLTDVEKRQLGLSQ